MKKDNCACLVFDNLDSNAVKKDFVDNVQYLDATIIKGKEFKGSVYGVRTKDGTFVVIFSPDEISESEAQKIYEDMLNRASDKIIKDAMKTTERGK